MRRCRPSVGSPNDQRRVHTKKIQQGKYTAVILKYSITGMTCDRCAVHIAEEVSELDGVTGVNVSHESAEMMVQSKHRIPFDAIIEAVSEAGEYSVVEA